MTDTSKRLNQESLQRNLMNNDFRTFMDQQRGLRLQQDSELADMRVRLRALEERLNQREAESLGTRCRSASRWLRRHLCCCFHWTARGERIAIVAHRARLIKPQRCARASATPHTQRSVPMMCTRRGVPSVSV